MTGPPPAVAAVRSAVRRALTGAGVADGDLVLVAVSGGADSLSLAAATAFVAPRLGLRAGAVVVDHGLQQGSAGLAQQVAGTCRALGLAPVRVTAVEVQSDGTGPESAARTARYLAVERALDDEGAVLALLGHTSDDQAETVLLGLARGSGTRSLAGMAPRRGRLLRPLLGVDRATTAAACAASGLTAWQDPHNADPRFARVRARALLPQLEQALGPGAVRALARTADLARADADALDRLAADAHDAVALVPGGTDLDVAALLALDPAVRGRVLQRAVVAAGSPAGSVAQAHLEAVQALVTDWHGQDAVALPGRVSARRRCGRLTFVDAKDMGPDLHQVLISQDQISARLAELAATIDADYAGRDLLLVGVLKGAVMVMADLARALHSPAEMDWMAVSSYGSGTKSSGVVRILKDLDKDISGRDVLIVEDIVDSGLTLSWLVSNLGSRGPASVEVCTLLRKPESAKVEVDVKYVGFDIDPEFVIGYGLDYNEKYRNLPFVGTLAAHVYS